MGWLFKKGFTRADIIDHCKRSQENEHGRWTTVAHCTKGNVLWSVVDWYRKDTKVTERFIGCHLLACDRGFGWGYKDLCESMDPCELSCPLSFLEMTPVANEGWRIKVRERHARMRRKFVVGEIWTLVNAKVRMVEITSVRPLRGRCLHTGVFYRIPRKLVGERLLKTSGDVEINPVSASPSQARAA